MPVDVSRDDEDIHKTSTYLRKMETILDNIDKVDNNTRKKIYKAIYGFYLRKVTLSPKDFIEQCKKHKCAKNIPSKIKIKTITILENLHSRVVMIWRKTEVKRDKRDQRSKENNFSRTARNIQALV